MFFIGLGEKRSYQSFIRRFKGAKLIGIVQCQTIPSASMVLGARPIEWLT